MKFQEDMKLLGIIPVWVIPITDSEVNILDNQGWKALEDYWDVNNTDLYSPYRD